MVAACPLKPITDREFQQGHRRLFWADTALLIPYG